jgi:anti-sigma regulatory factor (Ser/Thr protein kinase)
VDEEACARRSGAGALFLAKSLEGACRRWHHLIQSSLRIDLMVMELAINALSHAYPCDRSDGTVVVTYELADELEPYSFR